MSSSSEITPSRRVSISRKTACHARYTRYARHDRHDRYDCYSHAHRYYRHTLHTRDYRCRRYGRFGAVFLHLEASEVCSQFGKKAGGLCGVQTHRLLGAARVLTKGAEQLRAVGGGS